MLVLIPPAHSSRGSALMVRRLRPTHLHIWKVFVHAVGADAMTEIQRAVLHQEPFNRLPEPFSVADRLAVAAGGDQALCVMHLTELIHQGQGAASEFQQGGGLFR